MTDWKALSNERGILLREMSRRIEELETALRDAAATPPHPDEYTKGYREGWHDREARIAAAAPTEPVEYCPICNGDCAGANPPVYNCPVAEGKSLRSEYDRFPDAAPTPTEPAAYLHTLHMDLGQTRRQLMWTEQSPFGIAGKHYDATYTVSCVPLYLGVVQASEQDK